MSGIHNNQGNFANMRKEPNKKRGGLDWDKIRADYEAKEDPETLAESRRIARQIEGGRAPKEPRAKGGVQKGDKRPGVGGRNPGARGDVDEVVRLYVHENMKPKDIAERMGYAYETTLKYLKDRKVFDPAKFKSHFKEGNQRRG